MWAPASIPVIAQLLLRKGRKTVAGSTAAAGSAALLEWITAFWDLLLREIASEVARMQLADERDAEDPPPRGGHISELRRLDAS